MEVVDGVVLIKSVNSATGYMSVYAHRAVVVLGLSMEGGM